MRGLVLLGIGLTAAAAAPVAAFGPSGWIGTAAVGLLGVTALVLYARHRFLGPLQDLAAGVGKGGEGDIQELIRLLASEHRELAASLASSKRLAGRQSAALAHVSDGVALLDSAGSVEYANPVARWLVHDRVLDLTRRITEPQLEALVARASATDTTLTEELTLRLPEARNIVARALPLRDGGCVLLLQDRSEADRLDRVRRDLVANVSHELKTPVAGLRALADVARSALGDGDSETASKFLARMQSEAERLSRLVVDLLDLSKVESGSGLELRTVEVRQILASAADQARPVADEKGVVLRVGGDRAELAADPAQLAMAVQNLVDNAVRYSDRGTVTLSAERREGEVAITVADEGIGIPQTELNRIFERFYRVDRARSRATGGTGLGLAIVRHVVENHGGRVEVRSELGLGSVFTLLLPASGGPQQTGTAA